MLIFKSKKERLKILEKEIEHVRACTLLGLYEDYSVGEKKIRKMQKKIDKIKKGRFYFEK